MTTNANTPRYNRCDVCGRNAHKVAVRVPIKTRNLNWAPGTGADFYINTGRTEVRGYCPSCFDGIPTGHTLVYDRRSDREKAKKPITPTTEGSTLS